MSHVCGEARARRYRTSGIEVITTVILISARIGLEQLLNDRSITISQLDKETGSCRIHQRDADTLSTTDERR
jgi:hypothetical protein